MSVNKFLMALILAFGICGSANADVWSWIDAKGDMHFVDTIRPIYTWQDDYGKVFFSDKPDHVNAVSVELVWHSTGSLDDIEEDKAPSLTRMRYSRVKPKPSATSADKRKPITASELPRYMTLMSTRPGFIKRAKTESRNTFPMRTPH